MKKLFNKLLCVIIALSVSLSLVACGTKDGGRTSVGEIVQEFGVRYDATDDSKPLMLVDKGVTKYKIVYPENINVAETMAMSELVIFLRESFGITFQTIPDNKASLDLNNYYISIGETSLIKSLDGTNDKVVRNYSELKETGFTIANRGNVVFICGAEYQGTITGTYAFLEKEVNFEQFAIDEIYVDKLDSKVIYDFENYSYTPNVQYTVITGGPLKGKDKVNSFRQHLAYDTGSGTDAMTSVFGMGYGHTIPEVFKPTDPEYKQFYPDGLHFCLTNQGKEFDDPTSGFEFLANYVVNNIASRHQQGLVIPKIYELGMNDDVGKCSCESCKVYYREHIDSEAYLNLLNHIAKKIKAYCDENGVTRKIVVQGLMYNLFETPPTKYDEATGTYVPLNENIYMHENAAARWTPISSCFSHAWNDPNCAHNSKTYIHKIEGWAALTDNLSLWSYGIYFQGAGGKMYFPDVGAIKGQADYFAEHPFIVARWETNLQDKDGTFYELKDYLRGKLFYDNRYDFDVLYNKFFENYYKAAAPAMKKYMDLTMANFNDISLRKGFGNCIDCWYNMFIYHDKGDWSYEVILALENVIKEAYALIEASDYDAETKAKLVDRVASDGLMYKHFLLSDFRTNYTKEELAIMDATYLAECEKAGVTNRAGVK